MSEQEAPVMDSQYRQTDSLGNVAIIKHLYGPEVHILNNVYIRTILAQISDRRTTQPRLDSLLDEIYTSLVRVAAGIVFPSRIDRVETPMIEYTPQGVWIGTVIDTSVEAIVTAILGAGLAPAHICHRELCNLMALGEGSARLDSMTMERQFDGEGKVSGVDVSGVKIRGKVQGKDIFIPDPMVATGETEDTAMARYKAKAEKEGGRPPRFISLNLVVTPEGIRRIITAHPDAIIIAGRLDRGLSSARALASVPGEYWDEEKGLNEHDYVVPGLGDFGKRFSCSEV